MYTDLAEFSVAGGHPDNSEAFMLWLSFRRLTELTDGQLRFVGMVSIGIGLLALWLLGIPDA